MIMKTVKYMLKQGKYVPGDIVVLTLDAISWPDDEDTGRTRETPKCVSR